ncbi:MAG: DUF1844 domain-containing protein [Deltaproteobacteria bacterium]|nr:DUF1844 domain-containing protein [Deltaproteobacteria bacterium]
MGDDSGFKIKDRRRFDAEGNERDESDEVYRSDRDRDSARSDQSDHEALPQIDFSTFILSLGTSAMVHLGEGPDPDGQQHRELGLAKQTIDLLALLREKTEGNRTEHESKLLDELLYDLRLRFVHASKQGA